MKPTSKPLQVGAVVFYVKDLKRSEAFYRETMGMKTTLRQEKYDANHPDESMLMVEAGEVTLIFFQKDERIGRTPIVVFTLADGGIENLVENLAKHGVQIILPVSEAPGGWTSDFLDPDGHVLSFYQSSTAPKKTLTASGYSSKSRDIASSAFLLVGARFPAPQPTLQQGDRRKGGIESFYLYRAVSCASGETVQPADTAGVRVMAHCFVLNCMVQSDRQRG